MKKRNKILLGVAIFVALFVIAIFSITLSNDPVSTIARKNIEFSLNKHIKDLSVKSSQNKLDSIDRFVLHTGVMAGIVASWVKYPEAAAILYHYVYGDGSDLKLEPNYFKQSKFIKKIIREKDPGNYGPIAFKQSDDWRLSLAINPFYIKTTQSSIKIYYPKIEFAGTRDKLVYTIIPIGKLRIRLYDNLVSALETAPFYVYAEWPITQNEI